MNLQDPELWNRIGRKLCARHPGPNYCEYDLSDDSHAIDVAQMVCQLLADEDK